jgi:hypothetical protein
MSPSIHSDFIYRLSGSISPRAFWDHVVDMMLARTLSSLDEATPDLTNEDAWLRYREKMGWNDPENFAGDEFSPTLH